MGAMKDIYTRLLEAFPSNCPNCQAELCDHIKLEQLNQVLDEVSAVAEENARGKLKLACQPMTPTEALDGLRGLYDWLSNSVLGEEIDLHSLNAGIETVKIAVERGT